MTELLSVQQESSNGGVVQVVLIVMAKLAVHIAANHTRVPSLPVHHLVLHGLHHVNTIRLELRDSVWVLMVQIAAKEVVHSGTMKTLSLRDGAVFVRKQ